MAEAGSEPINMDMSGGSVVSNEDARRIAVWVNPVPMDFGIISTGDRSPAKFTFSHLKKLLTYAQGKGKHSYPWLSYSVWQHIAKNKLHLSEELSWLYFETFDTVSDVGISDRLKLMDLLSKCKSSDDTERIHKQVCVDTVKFILFLYLQNAPRLSLCVPLVTGEEWPSPEYSNKKSKSSSDHTHLSFVRTHLHDILQLASESVEGDVISINGIRALEFILLSSVDKKPHLPLTSLAMLPTESSCNGMSQDSKSFSLTSFETWLRSHLVLNPYGPQAMKGGARDRRCPCFKSDTHGRIVTNIQSGLIGSHSVLIHGVIKQTLAKGDAGLDDSLVYVQNCKSSYVYLMGAMKGVVIDKCSRCVIVLGAVERSLVVNNCNELCLVSACRRIQICSSSYSTFHLLTMTRPLLLASNHKLTFAPYNTSYPLLEEHLQKCGLVPSFNLWDNPLGLVGEAGNTWSLMDPAAFYTMEVPFVMDGPTKENPAALPVIYQEALEERKKRIADWYSTVKQAKLTPEKQRELQKAVQDKFKEWLELTGHKREIYDLGRNASEKSSLL